MNTRATRQQCNKFERRQKHWTENTAKTTYGIKVEKLTFVPPPLSYSSFQSVSLSTRLLSMSKSLSSAIFTTPGSMFCWKKPAATSETHRVSEIHWFFSKYSADWVKVTSRTPKRNGAQFRMRWFRYRGRSELKRTFFSDNSAKIQTDMWRNGSTILHAHMRQNAYAYLTF